MSKFSREVVFDEELHRKIASGIDKVFLLAKAGYGPGAANSLLEQKFGDPMLSRDGVSNIRHLYLEDPTENMACRLVVQASMANNINVGDGTTAVALLTRNLYLEGRKLVVAGYHRMKVAEMLREDMREVIKQVESQALPFSDDLLKKVALTSTGDEAIAEMLKEIFKKLGPDAATDVVDSDLPVVSNNYVDGFYFKRGFTHVGLINQPLRLMSYHQGKVPILISEKKWLTKTDAAVVLEKLLKNGIREVVLVAECNQEVLEVFASNWGIVSIIPVDIPYHEGLRTAFLEDLAALTDGEVYKPADNPDEFSVDMLGFAKKVVINERSTTIIGQDGSKAAVKRRINELKEELSNSTATYDIEILRERIARLSGKLASIKVGAATDVERDEMKLRLDDAIAAIRASYKAGVVPGGAVTLARVKAKYFTSSYQDLIKMLADNIGENPESILQEVQKAKDWYGYDLKNKTERPINLLKAGILDPTLVITEMVRNATSIAASLITAGAGHYLVDREAKID